jgi:hypothetical protein
MPTHRRRICTLKSGKIDSDLSRVYQSAATLFGSRGEVYMHSVFSVWVRAPAGSFGSPRNVQHTAGKNIRRVTYYVRNCALMVDKQTGATQSFTARLKSPEEFYRPGCHWVKGVALVLRIVY